MLLMDSSCGALLDRDVLHPVDLESRLTQLHLRFALAWAEGPICKQMSLPEQIVFCTSHFHCLTRICCVRKDIHVQNKYLNITIEQLTHLSIYAASKMST